MRADARRNRERVLEAARSCFAEQGVDAQMDHVASQAGVGVGTIYRHFPTKDALMAALAEDYFEGEAALAERALEADDPWEAFCGFLRNGADLLAANRGLSQFIADRPEIMLAAALEADARRGFFTTVEALIRRAQQAGALRPDFELEDIPSIMCSLGSLQISRGAYKNWPRVLEMVIDGLRAPGAGTLPPVVERLPRGAQLSASGPSSSIDA
jgi:AcrR family transcriptional regulator